MCSGFLKYEERIPSFRSKRTPPEDVSQPSPHTPYEPRARHRDDSYNDRGVMVSKNLV